MQLKQTHKHITRIPHVLLLEASSGAAAAAEDDEEGLVIFLGLLAGAFFLLSLDGFLPDTGSSSLGAAFLFRAERRGVLMPKATQRSKKNASLQYG